MRNEKKLEEVIIDRLGEGAIEKAELIEYVCKKTVATPQGAYKALRKLKKDEVVTRHDKTVSLSFPWISNQISKFTEIAEVYKVPARENYFLQLKPGEYVSFKFRNLRELDIFWTHAFLLLETQLPKKFPAYSVVPHDWFSYARPSTDKAWGERLDASTRQQGVVITHPASLDKKVLGERKSKFLEYIFGENPYHQDERKYFNIIGQWIFEAKLDAAANHKLIEWIKNNPEVVVVRENAELWKIIDLAGSNTLKISRAPRRAETMSRKLNKYFTFKNY